MQEKVLTVNISEAIYTNIAYFVQKYINDAESIVISGLLDNNFRLLSPEMRAFIDEMTLDVVNAMKQYLGDTHTHAVRYRMLPSIIQSFIEADPSDVFLLGNRMTEAVQSRDALKKICKLSEEQCAECRLNCDTCFVDSTRKIMVESGLIWWANSTRV